MAIGPRGDVLVATDHGVAYRDGGRWRTVAFSAGVGAPLATVRSVFVDREGTTWIGGTGLIQLRGRGVIERHGPATGLPGDAAWSFQHDREGALWIGTSRCLARAVAGRWECLPGTEGGAGRANSSLSSACSSSKSPSPPRSCAQASRASRAAPGRRERACRHVDATIRARRRCSKTAAWIVILSTTGLLRDRHPAGRTHQCAVGAIRSPSTTASRRGSAPPASDPSGMRITVAIPLVCAATLTV